MNGIDAPSIGTKKPIPQNIAKWKHLPEEVWSSMSLRESVSTNYCIK